MIMSNVSLTPWGPDPDVKTAKTNERHNLLKEYNKCFREYTSAVINYPKVNFRYFVNPSEPLPLNKFPFFFLQKDTVKMIEMGYKDGLNAIKKGPGVSAHEAYVEGLN